MRRAPAAALLLGLALVSCRPPPPADPGDADAGGGGDAAPGADGAAPPDAAPLELPDRAGPCTPGEQRCAGVELDTCGSTGAAWIRSKCFPGTFCQQGACAPIGRNLVVVFDTSGSMATPVAGVTCGQGGWPDCAPDKGCTRMDVSKVVFADVLAQLDGAAVSLALFHFPNEIVTLTPTSCAEGPRAGRGAILGDPGSQTVSESTKWFWSGLGQVLAVGFPRSAAEAALAPGRMATWMNGVETLVPTSTACSAPQTGCVASQACGAGACCGGLCYAVADGELRATGGTPIGKTLFYVGEYLRHRVLIDGRACAADADCGTPHHRCVAGRCDDPARGCRETTVVIFTDGGQLHDPKDFFSPLAMARRLAFGLGCESDAGCAQGARCLAGRCAPESPTGMRCLATGAPCAQGAPPGDPLHCPASPGVGAVCIADPALEPTAKAAAKANNVLRAPDGQPFGARVHVVDVSGDASALLSFALASAGGGRVLTADTTDTAALFGALSGVFDLKNMKVCGNTL